MLIDCLGTTEELSALFSDQSVLDAMLQFEIALARAQARLQFIPEEAAREISGLSIEKLEAATIARQARESASVAIPFVKALRAQSDSANEYAHRGATSQDLIDTTLVLLLKRARPILQRDHRELVDTLLALSDKHKDTVMLGRTLMQSATPITFGYKVAAWRASLVRSWTRLSHSLGHALLLQFGGASGTLAAFGDRGPMLAAELAKELDLGCAPPWHTQRDRLASVMTNLGIYTGTLGKIARDVTLLMQSEIGEVSEQGGGSSAMPHKRNPSSCAIVLAAATRVPGLVSTYLSAMIQENERAAGTWQSEWPTVAAIVSCTGSALAALLRAMSSLEVHTGRMKANLDAAGDAILSEKAVAILTPNLGREAAERAVAEALKYPQAFKETLNIDLGESSDYLGASELFRRRLIEDTE